MTDTSDTWRAAVEAALALAAEHDWCDIPLAEIAEAAGRPLDDFYAAGGKDGLMDAIEPHFDRAMSAEAADPEDTARERLFDVIMRRFEAMEPHRPGLLSIFASRDRAPARLAALLGARRKSAEWALVCAGLDTGAALPAAARVAAVAWAIAQAERAWRRDENGDFARTMATLDKELREAEERQDRVSRLFGGRPRRRGAASAADADAPEAPPAATSPE